MRGTHEVKVRSRGQRAGVVVGVLAACLLLIALVASPFVWARVTNNARLNQLVQDATQQPLPAGSIDYALPPVTSQIGNFAPAGNECDYVVRRSFTSPLSQAELRAFFAKSPLLPMVYIGDSAAETNYVILEFHADSDAGLDFRCW
jgi:hypothetical protein